MVDQFRRDVTFGGVLWLLLLLFFFFPFFSFFSLSLFFFVLLKEGSTCTGTWKQWFRQVMIDRFRRDVTLAVCLAQGREHL